MNQRYECSYCSKMFDYRKKLLEHEHYCGMSRITDYDDSGEFSRLEGMNQALRKNEYDIQAGSGRKIKQKTLRNKEVTH